MPPKVIYVDVDDTLVRSAGTKRMPIPNVVDAVRRLHAEGAQIYLWSTAGADYAASVAKELRLESCVIGCLPKPNAYVDDQAVSEWRDCRHVLPGNAGDA